LPQRSTCQKGRPAVMLLTMERRTDLLASDLKPEVKLPHITIIVAECVCVLLQQQVLQDSALGHQPEQVVVTAEENMQTHLQIASKHCSIFSVATWHRRTSMKAIVLFLCCLHLLHAHCLLLFQDVHDECFHKTQHASRRVKQESGPKMHTPRCGFHPCLAMRPPCRPPSCADRRYPPHGCKGRGRTTLR